MNYKLSITPKTYLHCGSGEGGVLVDSDVVFHPSGFPMIPARRLKGLLRESLTEVLEIMGENDQIISNKINEWFGKSGDDYANGIIKHVGNGYVAPWTDIKTALSKGENPGKDAIVAYTTTEVQQTALGDNGIAKKHSLRNYRVVNPRENFSFEAAIQCGKSLSAAEKNLLNQAVQNLRFIGSRRNRGLGQVSCTILETQAVATAANNGQLAAANKGYAVTLTTLSPVIISRQDGDMSTLQTDDVITGAQLRGALARAFMQQHQLTKANAHENEVFHKLFLSGEIQFGNLYFNNAKPIPAFVHKPKYVTDAQPVDVFKEIEGPEKGNQKITKPSGGIGTLEWGNGTLKVKKLTPPQKQSNFHNSRQNRTAGRNTGGELFYYEALQEDQIFHGTITGTPEALQLFSQAFSSQLQIRLGRSKSAQYGAASVSLSPLSAEINKVASNDGGYLLMAESPLVLVNDNNFPAINKEILKKALESKLGSDSNIEIEKVAGSTTMVESYNAVWQAKSGKYPAYSAGTTFKITVPNGVLLASEICIGKFAELGFGKCRIINFINDIELKDHSSQAQTPTTGSISNSAPAILRSINRIESEKKIKQQLEESAILSAKGKAGKLNNHQCGRLEHIFMASEQTDEKVKMFLQDVKGKPLGDSLAKANILLDRDKDVCISIPSTGVNSTEWQHQRHYWLSFFRSLRKFNQHKKKQDERA